MALSKRIGALVLGGVAVLGTVAYADLLVDLRQIVYPETTWRPGTITFDAASGFLNVAGTPIRTHFGSSDTRAHAAAPPSAMRVNARVLDPAGTAVEGGAAPDFFMEGAVDVDGDGTIEAGETGVLLTGDIVAMAHQNPAPDMPGTSRIGLRFSTTGGILAPFYAGRNIGVEVQVSSASWPQPSTPNSDFASSFSGGAQGFVKPVQCGVEIGDFIWHDLNHNGVQDPGEPGLNDIGLVLRDASGTVVATTTSRRGPLNQTGYYSFDHIDGFCGGTYTVELDLSTLPDGFFPTVSGAAGATPATDSNASPATVVLASDVATDQTIDFGVAAAVDGHIAGVTWHDVDEDGIRTAPEPLLDGVRVNLFNAATNALVASATTMIGEFAFTGLDAGDYRVEVDPATLPLGFQPTLANVGEDDRDSDGSPVVVTLNSLTPRVTTLGFGYVTACTGGIGDFVWNDVNQNGKQDVGEPGIGGVDVTLQAADGAVLAVTSSGANGAYSFTGLCAGTYKVVIDAADLPQYFSPTVSEAPGSSPTTDSNGSPATVVLSDDTKVDDTVDFGFAAPCMGRIGDRVWHDENQNGIQDAGEANMAGVTVRLRRQSDNAVIQTEVTGADGRYLFSSVCPGYYAVEMVPPDGSQPAPTLQGADRSVDSNTNPTPVTLALHDSADLTIDFGVYGVGEIGDFVWHDVNGNGIQEAGEPGIAGVTLTLTDAHGHVFTTTTDAGGKYLFSSLFAGAYEVSVAAPAGFAGPTVVEAGSSREQDSNPNPTIVVVSRDERKTHGVDFGFIKDLPPPPPGLKLEKTALKTTVTFGEAVTFQYVVTNTGSVPLTDVVVVDDNATPRFSADDFTVGTLATLAPGASHTFTATRIPPTKMCNFDWDGKLRKCGLLLVWHVLHNTKFTYLQAKDHRDDYHGSDGWSGSRAYASKGKFRVVDAYNLSSQDVNTTAVEVADEEYVSAFAFTMGKSFVSAGNDSVHLPRIFHKKGWDLDWHHDWDSWWGNLARLWKWDDDWWDHDNDQDYDYDRHPKPCTTTSTNVAKATAKYAGGTLTATDKATVEIVAPAPGAPYKTYTQGGWGAKPSGNNPGKFLRDNFSRVYRNGYVVIGGTKTIKLTSAYAVEKFLPQGSTPAKLAYSYINPTHQITVLAGQVLALRLNVDFSTAGLTRTGLGNLTVVSGELAGRTVNQVLSLANTVLGGGSLPSGLTLSELNSVLTKINENFDGGNQNNGYLTE
jgi:hypothetical protein